MSYLIGLVALGCLLAVDPGQPTLVNLGLALLLAVAGAGAQVLTIARSRTHYSDHLTPAPIAAAILLLSPALLAFVVVMTFVPDWIYHRRKWYIQCFNIASWLTAAAISHSLLQLWASQPLRWGGDGLSSVVTMLALLVFLAFQTLHLVLVLWTARGQSPFDSGLLTATKLGSDCVLLSLGWTFAVAWGHSPLAALAAALPAILVFQALHVPNLRDEAASDPRTGLSNARHFREALGRELERAVASQQPLTLVICDLDHLRTINNTYGHQAGDAVIQGVANRIRHNVRACDCAARIGGEEFALVLVGIDRSQAWQVAERLRAEIEQHQFVAEIDLPPIKATVSIGVAGFPTDGHTLETLVREADLALYKSKADGRNRVTAASRSSRELMGEWTRSQRQSPLFGQHAALMTDKLTADGGLSQPAEAGLASGAGQDEADTPTPLAAPAASAASPRASVSHAVQAFIGSMVLLAGLGLSLDIALRPLPTASLVGLLCLAVMVAIAEQGAIDIGGRGKTSVSAVAILAAGLLYHGLGVLVVAVVFALWAKFRAGSPPHRLLFNLATITLSALGADLVFTLFGRAPLDATAFPLLLLPALLAGLTFYVINHLLLCIVRSLTEGRSVASIWGEHYRWLWPHYAALGVLALLLTVGYTYFGWTGLLALSLPVGMMHIGFRQYLERSKEHVAKLQQMNRQLTSSYQATLDALSRALDTRDEETEEHSRRVQRYCELLAKRYGVPDEEVAHISRGALLHDIGKIGVPDAILLKPGRLSEEEQVIMQRHPAIGSAMIAHIPFLAKAAEVVLHHHEAYDGSGYPSGLAATEIPLGARIFAVADALDAMTSDRPYRRARPFAEAYREIDRCRGSQFDPRIVDVLLSIPQDELIAWSGEWAADATTRPSPALSLLYAGTLVEYGGVTTGHVGARPSIERE